MSKVILGIDASNIREGGGVTHLVELLRNAEPQNQGITKVIVWSGSKTLETIENRPWLKKINSPKLDKGLLNRMLWQLLELPKAVKASDCDVLFVPGGSYAGLFRPFVTMSQNLLPFEWREILRFGWSLDTLKLLILRWSQSRTFKRAGGVIYLADYAKRTVLKVTGALPGKTVVIPHGINSNFFLPPRRQRLVEEFKKS